MARYKAPAENIINTSIGEIKNGGGRTGARIVGKGDAGKIAGVQHRLTIWQLP